MRNGLAVSLILAILVGAGLLWHELSFGECTQDDSFISFRYARNLVDGNGLVYNPGGERVEGYTNFLWTLILAGVISVGGDPVPISRLLGILISFLILLGMQRFSARVFDRSGWQSLIGLPLVAASSAFATEAVQGLETLLFTLWILSGTYALMRARYGEKPGWVALSAVLFGLASLTRPEGLMVGGLAFLYLVAGTNPWVRFRDIREPSRRGGWVRIAGTWLAIFSGIFLPYFAWRYSYYGYPVPNTFYAKTGGGWPQVIRGAGYAGDFLLASLPLVLLAGAYLFGQRNDRNRRAAFPALVIVIYTAYIISVGGDFKATFRFFMPVFPFLVLLAQETILMIRDRLGSRRIGATWVVVTVLICSVWNFTFTSASRDFAWILHQSMVNQKLIAQHLDRILGEGDLLAIGTAGIIPYYTGLPTIDMWGLNDLHIAHKDSPWSGLGDAGHEKGDGKYVFEKRPELIIFRAMMLSPAPFPIENLETLRGRLFLSELELLGIPEFLDTYEIRSDYLVGFYFNYFRLQNEPNG